MLIGALQKFSLLDYPGKISAIVFTQGCNFRCKFCYNPTLVWSSSAPQSGATADKPAVMKTMESGAGKLKYAQKFIRQSGKSSGQQKVHPIVSSADVSSSVKNTVDKKTLADKQDDLFVFLKSRAGKLDAVVITGGEPCLQKDLYEFIKKVKKLGFLVKLDTNGSNPDALSKLIKGKLIDYIAMDLKAPEGKYSEVTGTAPEDGLFNLVKKSVKIIMGSGLPYEFRTTVVPGLLESGDIAEMGKIIRGADVWYLQNFKSDRELVGKDFMGRVPYNGRQMNEMAEIGSQYVKRCEVR